MLKQRLGLGISFTLVSALLYALVTALVKANAAEVATPVIVFIQTSVSFSLLMAMMMIKGKLFILKTVQSKVLPLHILRTLFSLGIGYCLFYAVRFIPLIDAVLLANTAPLLVPFIAFLFLRHSFNHKLWIPILIGFSGVAIILNPDGKIFNLASIVAFGSAICMATSMLIVRQAAKTDDKMTTLFYYFLFGTLISGLVSIPFWHVMSFHVALALISSGVLFFLVQYTLTLALTNSDATVVSSLYYSNILFAALLAVFIWHGIFTILTLVGMLLAIIGGVLVIQFNAKLSQSRIK